MPGMVAPFEDEQEGLLAYLEQMRLVLRIAAHGLTDEQARSAPSASALSVGGLIKHVAFTERGWMDNVMQRDRPRHPDDDRGFTMGPDETLADVLALQAEIAADTEREIRAIGNLDHQVPVPKGVPWFPDDIDAWSVRWVLLHVIQETARHAGHADIVRESIDGASAFPLMAAHEGWPDTPWMQKWELPAP